MKRQKRRVKKSNQPAAGDASGTGASRKKTSRREALSRLSSIGLVVAAVVGIGWYLVQDVGAKVREMDLSQIGNGTPTVVQIHDPQCPRCVALQEEARSAMSDLEDVELQFLVANIRSAEGRRLAAAHGVSHLTLLLFDGAGKRRDVLQGSYTKEHLTDVFRQHAARSGRSS